MMNHKYQFTKVSIFFENTAAKVTKAM